MTDGRFITQGLPGDLCNGRYLQKYLDCDDDSIDPGLGAIAICAVKYKIVSPDRYFNHVKVLQQEALDQHRLFLSQGADDDAMTCIAALKDVLYNQYGYQRDEQSPNLIDNANMAGVIDRRKGGDVPVGLLYLSCGRTAQWNICGLTFPASFVLRLDYNGQSVIFDPANSCAILQAPDLRNIIKQSYGNTAELSSDYYQSLSNRDCLVRMLNSIKFKEISNEDYYNALNTVELMRLIAPQEYRLSFDAGVLYAKTGNNEKAIAMFTDYMNATPHAKERQEAAMLIQSLSVIPDA